MRPRLDAVLNYVSTVLAGGMLGGALATIVDNTPQGLIIALGCAGVGLLIEKARVKWLRSKSC